MRRGTAVGYVRLALEDNTGDKIRQQREEISAYCTKHRLYLANIFEDNGASGSDFRRRGWSDLEDFLIDSNGSISYLVVAGLDRIGRNFYKVDKEIKRLKEEYGISIVPVRRHLGLENMLKKEIKKGRRKGI